MPRKATAVAPLTPEQQLLAESAIGLAYHLARGAGPAYMYDDLVAAGLLGLCRAAATFDGGRGVKFTTYAGWWCRSYMGRLRECEEAKRGAPDDGDGAIAVRPRDELADRDAAEVALARMTPRQARACRLRFGFGGRDLMTLRAAGVALGVSQQDAARLIAAGCGRAAGTSE